ncbi:MAG: HIT family protein [Thaumarchaeota archaeon]|nr:HIT family protein [Nitrososphaerota archaeon]
MDCIFCKIIRKEVPARFLLETKHSISFLDAFPLAQGHALVIPKNHREKIQDLLPDENADLFSLVQHTISKVDKITGATLVAIHNGKDAGQDIPHLHVHLVPRSSGDSAGAIHSMFDSTIHITDDVMSDLQKKLGS